MCSPHKCYDLNQTKHSISTIKMCENAIKIHVHKPFNSFFDKNYAWDFLVQKNLDNFVDYLGYYKKYFGSTVIVTLGHVAIISSP